MDRRNTLCIEALAEIKATIDGHSDQPVKDIIYGLIGELNEVPERIVAVANQFRGHIWTLPRPARHHHVLWAIDQVHPGCAIECYPEFQGFLTDTGRWVGRAQAATIAIAAGQTSKLRFSSRDLYSEDLW